MIQFARLELERDPDFRVFVEKRLAELRRSAQLPKKLEECLAYEVIPKIPLAKFLVEAFNRQATKPDWIRLKDIEKARNAA
jgi:hypothetical protein